MKFTKTLFVALAIILFVITGCSGIEDKGKNIEVEKRIGNENKYEEFREITDNKQVQKVKDILDEVDWKNAKVEMEHPADYNFWFRFKSDKMSAKVVLYKIWISPNKDKVEIVRGDNQYVKLNVEDSTDLFEILTGEKPSDL
ncbi:hypothetical protein MKZ08_13295 [Viridibacillus sp. FSL R5-0477]|uniref:Lipoprotein n=1 Tax=Viridibacillus arenosi FSL R5-213 TaxID=1227360 RepID=W4EW91_9BACL|nr:hypothetical protein [Viridibacillus arenosi]ETT84352.1 lipoprotein [Viridibacillus arenosi FSL R5-213]OMC86727.1 hypothetical protein BK137_21365 [Viridibacillus arenosi]